MDIDQKEVSWITRPDADNELKVLGYNIPVDFADDKVPHFPHAILGFQATPLLVSEQDMIHIMASLTAKPEWTRKIYDKTIVAKWYEEVRETEGIHPDDTKITLSEKQFEFCMEELKEYAKQQEQSGFFPVIDTTAAAYASDTMVSSSLKESFKAAVSVLEDVNEDKKDWHPNSEDKVLDLVHPSMYPLRYGTTKVLPNTTVPLQKCVEYMNLGNVIPQPESLIVKAPTYREDWADDAALYSENFQWLPSEVAFSGDEGVRITSYINNLHPEQTTIYEQLEQVISRIIPMWDATLSSTQRTDATFGWEREEDLDAKGCRYDTPPLKKQFEYEYPDLPEGSEDDPEFDEDQWMEDYQDNFRAKCRALYPDIEPKSFTQYTQDKVQPKRHINLRQDFADQGLQIIIKLANIHLTPDKPSYGGGTWHIEGQLNEHIVATAIYYYDTHNITPSSLRFREIVNTIQLEAMPEQNEYWWVEDLYGIEQDGEANQLLASVPTPEDRVLTFPNVFQHCVEPFELEDKSQAGHRKILALFLVDPNLRIPSTANVPPQQKEWLKPVVMGTERFVGLAKELQEMIWEFYMDDAVLDVEDAKEVRLKVIEERSRLDDEVGQAIGHQFSFCEH